VGDGPKIVYNAQKRVKRRAILGEKQEKNEKMRQNMVKYE